MYAKRIQIANYGPIERLDITIPIDEDKPRPIVLVGENGSGKSVLLSHIVNGLMLVQQSAYPDTSEVEVGKVYKLRSSEYVTLGKEFSFARVDFTDDFWSGELQLKNRRKQDYDAAPDGISGTDAQSLWNSLGGTDHSRISHKQFEDKYRVERLFGSNCILYFPPDRFEEPAWLNETNLRAKASHMDMSHLEGHTERKIINHSPLRDNQNWLFDLVYDFRVIELQTSRVPVEFSEPEGPRLNVLTVVEGYSGSAKALYDVVLRILRLVIGKCGNLRLGIGPRHSRMVSIMSGDQMLVPNIFQLSSGEVSLLNLFLSILRDYDLTRKKFTRAEDITGIVVVDEIDLHLHAHHQREILPNLMRMFPKVQFIVTSHSPLFALGLQEVFAENGFGLYHLPEGQSISPEEFSEFGSAYQAFANTRRHSHDIRTAVKEAQKPMVFVEGTTDVKYLERAMTLLNLGALRNRIEVKEVADGGGGSNLKKVWNGLKVTSGIRHPVVILHDCDAEVGDAGEGNIFRRRIKCQNNHPISKGIENLLSRMTLQRAMEHKPSFVNKTSEHEKTERGKTITVPEAWVVNKDEKTNLCNWLCENGTAEDFQHFRPVLEMLRELLEETNGVGE